MTTSKGIALALALALGTAAFGDRAVAQSDDEARAEREAEVARQRQSADEQRAELQARLEQAQRQLREAQQQMERASQEYARAMGELSRDRVSSSYRRFMSVFDQRARLGVNIGDDREGARVLGVTPGGPAAEAGIQTGDVIVAIDGAEIVTANGRRPVEVVVAQVENVEPGEEVTVGVLRDGQRQDFVVEADVVPGRNAFLGDGPGSSGPFGVLRNGRTVTLLGGFGRWADMELVELSPELGAYFGSETGLLVVRAPDDQQLQLADGDVIVAIGSRTPTSPEHAMRILNSFEVGETLEITIMRRQSRQTLQIVVPGPPAAG